MHNPWWYGSWSLYALGHIGIVAGQSTVYKFTVDVTSFPPVPGKPYTLTWTGGDPTEAVYIILNNYFPDLPDQNIPYGSTDILCKTCFHLQLLFFFVALTNIMQQTPPTTARGRTMCLSIFPQATTRSALATIPLCCQTRQGFSSSVHLRPPRLDHFLLLLTLQGQRIMAVGSLHSQTTLTPDTNPHAQLPLLDESRPSIP